MRTATARAGRRYRRDDRFGHIRDGIAAPHLCRIEYAENKVIATEYVFID